MSETLTQFLRLDGQGGAESLDPDAVLTEAAPSAVWLRCDQRDSAQREWLTVQALMPDLALETLLAESTRPRCMAIDDGLLLVIRGVNLNPGQEYDDMVAIRMWLEPGRLISCQRRVLRSANESAQSLLDGKGPSDLGGIVVNLVERLNDYIEDAVEGMVQEVEQSEVLVERDPGQAMRAGLGVLRRKSARLRRFLQPQREALERLVRQGRALFGPDQIEDLQQSHDDLTRNLEDLDLVRERAMVVQEELLNRIAQEQNNRVYLLSIVTAIFLPLTFLTGLLGMNVAGLPGLDDPRAFWLVSGLSMVVAVGLAVFFRMKRWF